MYYMDITCEQQIISEIRIYTMITVNLLNKHRFQFMLTSPVKKKSVRVFAVIIVE